VKASAFRRWPVTLGLIALVQTTRWTGGHDSSEKNIFAENSMIFLKYLAIFSKIHRKKLKIMNVISS